MFCFLFLLFCVFRLFHDRLVLEEERIWCHTTIDTIARSHYPAANLSVCLKRPVLYSSLTSESSRCTSSWSCSAATIAASTASRVGAVLGALLVAWVVLIREAGVATVGALKLVGQVRVRIYHLTKQHLFHNK